MTAKALELRRSASLCRRAAGTRLALRSTVSAASAVSPERLATPASATAPSADSRTGQQPAIALGSDPGLSVTGSHPIVVPGAIPPGVRVLVVDDDARVRRAIAGTLSRIGFDVRVADDGGPALASAEQSPPDLAVIDLGMPMSGLEVTRRLKAMYGPATTVTILTGSDGEDVRVAAFDAGADGYLVKPISMVELQRRMVASARSQQAYVEARQARENADRLLAWAAEASALLAHDLNNGLAVALSNITYLTSTLQVEEDDRAALQSTQRALRRMAGLVANFVDIARFEEGALKPRPTRVAVAALLDEVMALHAPSLSRQIRHEVSCDPQLIGHFDEPLIARVLHNLVGNAARYCNPGGQIRLSAQPWLEDGRVAGVELSVHNSGPPIPSELAPTLFSKYALGRGGQRGLGLYFCRLACEAHGGSVRHLSLPDGPVFVLRLPAA